MRREHGTSDATGNPVKCLVWDLDNTLWKGTLAEGGNIALKSDARPLIEALDQRGILQSIASKNDMEQAMEMLRKLGLDSFFLYPKIHWNPKSESIKTLAKQLNIGLDSIAFIDDQAFEREEVKFELPEVRTYDAAEIATLESRLEFNPKAITEDARNRRLRYQQEASRQQAEDTFQGTNEAFLKSLNMRLKVQHACIDDLDRTQELTQRTHQLNTTGLTFSLEELKFFIKDPSHDLWVMELEDRFGNYGKIGVVLILKELSAWNIRLLLLSCRVMSRGIGSALLIHLKNKALQAEVELLADFKPTDRNRMMYMTYKFAGFEELETAADCEITKLKCSEHSAMRLPDYLEIDHSM